MEHFVPKEEATSPRPHWRYEILNLLMACDACNQVLKGQFNPVKDWDELLSRGELPRRYKKLDFDICHPYLDNVRGHISGGPRGVKYPPVFVQACGGSDKGRRTIDTFRLANSNLRRLWQDDYESSQSGEGAGPRHEDAMVRSLMLEIKLAGRRTIH